MQNESNSLINFMVNMHETIGLLKVHRDLTGAKRGRRYDVEVLNKSTIVLLTACLESFFEEIIKESLHFIFKADDPSSLIGDGAKIGFISSLTDKSINNCSDSIWKLIDGGWKEQFEKYVDNKIEHFHSPRAEKVKDLFKSVLGIRDLTAEWKWRMNKAVAVRRSLDQLIDLRCSIAHKVKSERIIYKKDCERYGRLCLRIAISTTNYLSEHLHKKTGSMPWKQYPMV